MKQQEVIGSFKPADYETERVMATAKDGTKIPISIVYKKGFKSTDLITDGNTDKNKKLTNKLFNTYTKRVIFAIISIVFLIITILFK